MRRTNINFILKKMTWGQKCKLHARRRERPTRIIWRTVRQRPASIVGHPMSATLALSPLSLLRPRARPPEHSSAPTLPTAAHRADRARRHKAPDHASACATSSPPVPANPPPAHAAPTASISTLLSTRRFSPPSPSSLPPSAR